jgi:hypothetical protein
MSAAPPFAIFGGPLVISDIPSIVGLAQSGNVRQGRAFFAGRSSIR